MKYLYRKTFLHYNKNILSSFLDSNIFKKKKKKKNITVITTPLTPLQLIIG